MAETELRSPRRRLRRRYGHDHTLDDKGRAAVLRRMAGDDARYHFAPDSTDLARIYAEIAGDILCPAPAGGFWPGG